MANDRPFGYRMQLYSETGYNLTIRSSGEILGTQDDGDLDSRYLNTNTKRDIRALGGMCRDVFHLQELCKQSDINMADF